MEKIKLPTKKEVTAINNNPENNTTDSNNNTTISDIDISSINKNMEAEEEQTERKLLTKEIDSLLTKLSNTSRQRINQQFLFQSHLHSTTNNNNNYNNNNNPNGKYLWNPSSETYLSNSVSVSHHD